MRELVLLSLILLILCAFTRETWVTEAYAVRVTFYHPRYDEPCRLGQTASGMRCVADADVAALGPELLELVRLHYTEPAKMGAFPLKACWRCPDRWWGLPVRLCANGVCRVFRVGDTGSSRLQVDLPRKTWQEFGFPLEQGVFYADLQVIAEE